MMASLYHVYKALEEEIERNKKSLVYVPLYFAEELHRRAALEQDMACLLYTSDAADDC